MANNNGELRSACQKKRRRCLKHVPPTFSIVVVVLFKNEDTYNSLKSIIPSWFKSNVWNCNLKSTMSPSLNSGNSFINDRKSFSPISETKSSEMTFHLLYRFQLGSSAWINRQSTTENQSCLYGGLLSSNASSSLIVFISLRLRLEYIDFSHRQILIK